jgi:hypothetical protein
MLKNLNFSSVFVEVSYIFHSYELVSVPHCLTYVEVPTTAYSQIVFFS